jgi:flavoprotein, HI0933 family
VLSKPSIKKRLVVIGGGAAGFFCAVNAARQNPVLEVIILERTNKLLSKVKISGGGRCNVTHACFDIDVMSKCYPRGQHFVRKAFHEFFTVDTIDWFKERGVELKQEPDGRMFPVTDNSETIIHCLINEANKYKVLIKMNLDVKSIQQVGNQFVLSTSQDKISSDFVVIACGGYPKSSMFQWLTDLRHSISGPVPSLFTFNLVTKEITELMGVSVRHVRIKIQGTSFVQEGAVLITHWGLSGPAVLKLSAWGARELHTMNYHFNIHINWMPEYKEDELRTIFKRMRAEQAAKKISNSPLATIPARLWDYFLKIAGIKEETRFADLNTKNENALIRLLIDQTLEVKGKTTYKEEFVTAGGIQLNEVNAATMMSKKIPSLYFAGEILDVDGITGGYNFQHAWTSGWIAAKSITDQLNKK